MNFWVGVVFFCTSPETCYFYTPAQTFSSQQACYKEVKKFHTQVEEVGAQMVRSNCLYIQTGKTVNGKESISKS
jgi:hypothetical protein